MRAARFIVYVLMAVASAGCGAKTTRVDKHIAIGPDRFSSALLFDRAPRFPTAGQLATRLPWPAVAAPRQVGEVIYYRERFMDYQSADHHGHDFSVRRFDTYREGWAER